MSCGSIKAECTLDQKSGQNSANRQHLTNEEDREVVPPLSRTIDDHDPEPRSTATRGGSTQVMILN